MLDFINFVNKRRSDAASELYAPEQKKQTDPISIPKIDGGDAIGSLAGILGPSPEEKAEEEQRLLKHRQKMHGWTALFNGLRHLSNLYYTTKGAKPQKYGDPHTLIEQNYKDERTRLDNLQTANQKYYTNLWNLYRQGADEQRKNMLAEAQRDYYGVRAAGTQQRNDDNSRKADAQIDNTNARTEYTRERTNQLKKLEPLKEQELRAKISRLKHDANRPYGSSGRRSGGAGNNDDPFKELAQYLEDNPDEVGPILQEEGLGFYDPETKKFTFSKNVTKGMAVTGNERTRKQIESKKNKHIGW